MLFLQQIRMFNYNKYKEIADLIEKNQRNTEIVAISESFERKCTSGN